MKYFRNPDTFLGRFLQILLVGYCSVYFSSCASTRPEKPPVTIARAMESRTLSSDFKTVLKASINVLQDLSYTIDVLNSDVGLITASRTTEKEESVLIDDNVGEEKMTFIEKFCIGAIVAIFVAIIISAISSGNSDSPSNSSSSTSNEREGPEIYRYKVTVNLNEAEARGTRVRVSASGEVEQDGRLIQTGGVYEQEFFSKFFASLERALFLETKSID